METLKNVKKFLIMATVTTVLAACGGKGNDGGGTATVSPQGCQNCAGIASPTLLATAVADSIHMSTWPAEIRDLRIFGEGNNFTPGVSSIYNTYNGIITAQGVLRIKARIGDANWSSGSNSGCVVEAGDYALTTVRAGQMSLGTNIDIPEMNAGPLRVRITQGSSAAMLWRDGATVRLFARLHILSVGGQNCGAFFTDFN
jgi:hypothetical protein